MCISQPYCDNKQLQKLEGLLQSLISKPRYVSVSVSVAVTLCHKSSFHSEGAAPVRDMLVSRQRRENKRAGGNTQWLLKCLLPSGPCHFHFRALGQCKSCSQAKVSGVRICPPVGSHLAIVRMYNPLKGRELIAANDDIIFHIVCVLSFHR